MAGPEPLAGGPSRLATIALLIVLSLGAPPAHRAAARDSIDAAQFVQRLDVALMLARSGAAEPSTATMRSVREALGLPVDVDAPGGWSVSIPLDALLDGLPGSTASDFQRAVRHLQALRDRAAVAIQAAAPDERRVGDALGAAYRGVSPSPGLMARIRRGILDFLGGVVQRLTTSSGLGTALAWLALLALIAVGVVLFRRLRPVPERTVREPGGPVYGAGQVNWRERAEEALRRGDLVEAIRALYALLVSTLAGKGLVSDAASLTAGECRTAVATAPPSLSAPVIRATLSFERVVYGRQPPSPEDVDLLREAERMARRS